MLSTTCHNYFGQKARRDRRTDASAACPSPTEPARATAQTATARLRSSSRSARWTRSNPAERCSTSASCPPSSRRRGNRRRPRTSSAPTSSSADTDIHSSVNRRRRSDAAARRPGPPGQLPRPPRPRRGIQRLLRRPRQLPAGRNHSEKRAGKLLSLSAVHAEKQNQAPRRKPRGFFYI